jgi:hypothetical protein
MAFPKSFRESNSNKTFINSIKPVDWPLIIYDGCRYVVFGKYGPWEYIRELLIHKEHNQDTKLVAYPRHLVIGSLMDQDKELFESSPDPKQANCFLEGVLNKHPVPMYPIEYMLTISLSECAAIIKIYKTSPEDFVQKFGGSISRQEILPYPSNASPIFPCVMQFISTEHLRDWHTYEVAMYKNTTQSVIPDLQAFYEFIQLLDDKKSYFIYWPLEQIWAWNKYMANFILGPEFCQANFRTYPEYFLPTYTDIIANKGQRQRRAKKSGDLSKVPNISWYTICDQIKQFILVRPDGSVVQVDSDVYKIMRDFPEGSFLPSCFMLPTSI